MSLNALMDRTVTVRRYPESERGAYNSPQAGDPVDVVYPGRLEPTTGVELTQDRGTVLADWILYLPDDADVVASDQVIIDDVTYEVVGPPARGTGIGRIDHIEARLRHVTG